jgi:outer membrane protein TolC
MCRDLPFLPGRIDRSGIPQRLWHSTGCVCSLAFLLFWCVAAAAQEAKPPLLTEEDAVALALTNNRDTQKSKLDILRSATAVREARTSYLPQMQTWLISGYPLEKLQLTIPEGALGVYPGTGPIPGKSVDITSGSGFQMTAFVTAAQPLSQLYKVHLAVESAQLQQQLAAFADTGQRQKIAAQVKEAYHQIVEAEALVASDGEEIRALEEALRTVRHNVEQGTALKADELQVAATLAEQRITAFHDQNNLTTGREQLNELLGRDLDTQFTVENLEMPSSAETDLSAARAKALRQRPEIVEADLEVKGAELDERRERADYIPDVSAQVTYLGLPNVQFLSANSVNLGVSLKWQNPWDWGRRKAHIDGLKNVTQQQRLTAEDARQQILLDVDQRFRSLQEARLAVEAASLARDASAEKLRNLTNQYHEQAALLEDLLKQSADLEQKKASYSEAIQKYWSARADFERAIGEQ